MTNTKMAHKNSLKTRSVLFGSDQYPIVNSIEHHIWSYLAGNEIVADSDSSGYIYRELNKSFVNV